jgi:hypothetical protein
VLKSEIKCKKVEKLVFPEINGEFIGRITGKKDLNTEEDLKKVIKENIDEFFESESRKVLEDEIIREIVQENEVEIPDKLIDNVLEQNYNRYISQMEEHEKNAGEHHHHERISKEDFFNSERADDDNASGTTGVMELAEKISANKELFKRTFLFICFSGEEEGLLGSAYFTKSDLFSKYNIVAMMNFDMIGRLSNNKLIINGTGTSPVWNRILDEVSAGYNLDISRNPDGMGGSDQTSFTLKRVPILFFFTGLHEDYHQPTDDYWKINTEGEAKVLNLAYDIAFKLANADAKPEFTESAITDKEPSRNESFSSYVGTMPDFSSSENGFKIAGVKKGSPGDKAGLKEGDLMIKFGDIVVKNIYNYTDALKKYKPGETVDIDVLRDGKEMTFSCTLGKR